MLRRRGHTVEVAQNGAEAVAAAAHGAFDIILMDVQMPVMDGLEATRRIRARETAEGGLRRRIVAMTASAMRGDQDLCLEAGMDGYIAKPFHPQDLFREVEASPAAGGGP
jgi:CheY-like chemotaxis protein